MPSRWRIGLTLPGLRAYDARSFHGLVAGWMESHRSAADHRASVKWWSCSPLAEIDDDRFAVEIGILDDAEQSAFLDRMAIVAARPVRLGRVEGCVEPPAQLADADWESLATSARPVRRFELAFTSPTGFRSGRHTDLLPTPQRVFGHYRRIWHAFAPFEPHAAFETLRFHVPHLDLRTVDVPLAHERFSGVVGRMTIETESAHAGLCALALLAPFSGTGSRSTWGMGVTELRALCGDR